MSSSGSQPTIFGMFQKQEAKLVRMDSGERAELGAKVKGKADSAQRSADAASKIGAPPCGGVRRPKKPLSKLPHIMCGGMYTSVATVLYARTMPQGRSFFNDSIYDLAAASSVAADAQQKKAKKHVARAGAPSTPTDPGKRKAESGSGKVAKKMRGGYGRHSEESKHHATDFFIALSKKAYSDGSKVHPEPLTTAVRPAWKALVEKHPGGFGDLPSPRTKAGARSATSSSRCVTSARATRGPAWSRPSSWRSSTTTCCGSLLRRSRSTATSCSRTCSRSSKRATAASTPA